MFDNIDITNYYAALSKQYNLKFITLSYQEIDVNLLSYHACLDYLTLQAIPVLKSANLFVIATANPSEKNRKNINERWQIHQPIEFVVVARQNITAILAHCFRNELTHDVTYKRLDMDPMHSASYTFSLVEKVIVLLGLASFLIGFYITPMAMLLIVNLFFSMGIVTLMAFKMGLTIRLLRWPQKRTPDLFVPSPILPLYTILIPLLREKEITISILLKSLQALDYPQDKLDIKLLLEEDDYETIDVISKFHLPWYCDILLVPKGLPRSKPRACNYGLALAYGEMLTIYDAEDRPEADQLKKALRCFQENDEQTVCIQAPLNFYNYRENLLTKLFTIEYTNWFDSYVPGLVYLRAPVPLGGTSNHFKIVILRELGGWDPCIGTEDADIGMRIYRHNYKTNCITSTTYEEANTQLWNWFRQRARWNKGYMQTYLVNMRDPINMIKEIGIERFINFQLFVGGNVFIQLANLPLWIFLITTYIHYLLTSHFAYPTLLFLITFYNFLIGNTILLISEFMATYRRRLYCLLPYVPLKIFYWLLMSVAGYYAVYELLVRPGYWYKTEHGISKEKVL